MRHDKAQAAGFSLKRVSWDSDGQTLHAIRKTVFVDEQRVPEELEWDEWDAQCVHMLARAPDGAAIGTGRLLPDGHIGRMAVIKQWRGLGVGGAILRDLIAAALERGHANVVLNAQSHALKFYARFGFEVVSSEFMEAGIPHYTMRLELVSPKPHC